MIRRIYCALFKLHDWRRFSRIRAGADYAEIGKYCSRCHAENIHELEALPTLPRGGTHQ